MNRSRSRSVRTGPVDDELMGQGFDGGHQDGRRGIEVADRDLVPALFQVAPDQAGMFRPGGLRSWRAGPCAGPARRRRDAGRDRRDGRRPPPAPAWRSPLPGRATPLPSGPRAAGPAFRGCGARPAPPPEPPCWGSTGRASPRSRRQSRRSGWCWRGRSPPVSERERWRPAAPPPSPGTVPGTPIFAGLSGLRAPSNARWPMRVDNASHSSQIPGQQPMGNGKARRCSPSPIAP